MGGTITVTSIPQEGSVFQVSLPIERAHHTYVEHEEHADLNEFKNLKILVVEDNNVNQIVIVQMMENMGLKADLAVDGLDALNTIKNNYYDLVLMDIHMPIMGEIEASKAIQEEETIQPKPFISALSADVSDYNQEICKSAGMKHFLPKP